MHSLGSLRRSKSLSSPISGGAFLPRFGLVDVYRTELPTLSPH